MNAGQVHEEDAETEMDCLNRARESGLRFSPCGMRLTNWQVVEGHDEDQMGLVLNTFRPPNGDGDRPRNSL